MSTKAVEGGNNVGVSKPVIVTRDNLVQYLKSSIMVKDMPKKGIIILKFYDPENVNSDEDVTLIIEGTNVIESDNIPENIDVEIKIPYYYIPELGKGLCPTIKKAKANQELSVNTELSEAAFLWKYKGMNKYKDCLG